MKEIALFEGANRQTSYLIKELETVSCSLHLLDQP